MIYTLENDSLKVQVNSHGGELWSIQTKDGAEYLWQGDETYWKDRALNLFPYIARLTEGKYTLDGKTYDALIKEVDYNPLAHTVEEVDFQALVSNEMVHSTAEIILENEEKVMSGVLQDELKEVAYKALPADLVDKIKVDVAGMKIGDTLRVKDLEIAKNKNIHITTDPEAVVATVTPVHNVVPETETEAEETAEEK